MSAGARAELTAILRAALEAADAGAAVRAALVRRGDGLEIAGRALPAGARLVVAAAGKAAAAMAAGLEAAAGDRVARGLVVTKDGHAAGLACRRCSVREAAHPVPDARGAAAARELLALAAGCAPDEVLVVLLSGGASALLALPLPGLTLGDLIATTRALLASGAAIDEVNAVRKHLVEVAGGRLARAAGARRIHVLAVSDVPGDRLDVIGSGPCTPDPTSYADALAVVERRALRAALPTRVVAHLEAGARGALPESPKPGDPVFARVDAAILASNATALAAARDAARHLGLHAVIASGGLSGEAREVGRRIAALGGSVAAAHPVCLLAGGETTVTLRGPGRGGRNQELALAAALVLAGQPGLALLAAGTDGSDGPTDAAGAWVDGGTVARAAARGVDAQAALARNDSHAFFAAEGGLVRTGPTGTNVMDLVALRVEPAPGPVRVPAPGALNRPFPDPSESVYDAGPPPDPAGSPLERLHREGCPMPIVSRRPLARAALAAAFAFAVSALLPTGAHAQAAAGRKKTEGCLVSVDASKLVVKDRTSKKDVEFRVKQAASVLDKAGTVATKNGRKAQLVDLETNRPIIVYWVVDAENADGKFANKVDGLDAIDSATGKPDPDVLENAGCTTE